MLKLFNTLTRKKETFKPIKEGEVSIYSCGPTVYWYQHIGNMRMVIFIDTLKRTFLFNDYKVNNVINITDVGHLTSDADEGEDKMVKAIKREGLELNEESMLKIAKKYTGVFLEDMKKLNALSPTHMPKATEHIKEMIDINKKIEENGYSYRTPVGLIFDTSKFKDYNKLAKLKPKEMKFGSRVNVDEERKNPTDFALWISNQPNHIMQWDSPWGKGFPGWHIECTAMSSKYLGNHFDIHTGGEEHIPVHHTNEIAQSEAAFKVHPWVNYWLHLRWLIMKGGGKMSKSAGTSYLISDLESKGYAPLSFRYLCLLTHYRKHLGFDLGVLDSAQKTYLRLKNIISEIKDDGKINEPALKNFKKAMEDDLNTPKALAVLWNLVRDEKAKGKLQTIKSIDAVLGLDLLKEDKIEIPNEITELANKRLEARKAKNWKLSDEIRDKIKSLGYIVEDVDGQQKIKKI
jgi:cysteinyl-tRNA synthetase